MIGLGRGAFDLARFGETIDALPRSGWTGGVRHGNIVRPLELA